VPARATPQESVARTRSDIVETDHRTWTRHIVSCDLLVFRGIADEIGALTTYLGKPRCGAYPLAMRLKRGHPGSGFAGDRQPIEAPNLGMFGARKDGKAAGSGQRSRIEERIRDHGA
jgi:hypothetical protein